MFAYCQSTMKPNPGDLILVFQTNKFAVEVKGHLASRTEGLVYRYYLRVMDNNGNARDFGLHAAVSPDLDRAGLTPAEANSIQTHLDEIAKVVKNVCARK